VGSGSHPEASENGTPTFVGRWRVGALIGAGSAGGVHRAHLEGSAEPLAIKLMLPQWGTSDIMVARFQREIEMLQALVHPSIVPILAHGRLDDGRLWYLMPLLEGCDVAKLLARRGCLAIDEALVIMHAVCAALAVAHAHGIIHRDLKASNVFVGTQTPPRITLLDFGAARSEHNGLGLTAAGTSIGTPTSMAPEQVMGLDADARSDVYAAGILLYRMLTGRCPFQDGTDEQIMLDHLATPVPAPSELAPVPAALERLILRCLEKRPEDRYASATELTAALCEARGGGVALAVALARVMLYVDLVGDPSTIAASGLTALELACDHAIAAGFTLAHGAGAGLLACIDIGDSSVAAVTAARGLAQVIADAIEALDDRLAARVFVHLVSATLAPDAPLVLPELEAWLASGPAAGLWSSSAAA
jgi:eukaryotic-like serine/threonine-protein kinase